MHSIWLVIHNSNQTTNIHCKLHLPWCIWPLRNFGRWRWFHSSIKKTLHLQRNAERKNNWTDLHTLSLSDGATCRAHCDKFFMQVSQTWCSIRSAVLSVLASRPLFFFLLRGGNGSCDVSDLGSFALNYFFFSEHYYSVKDILKFRNQ